MKLKDKQAEAQAKKELQSCGKQINYQNKKAVKYSYHKEKGENRKWKIIKQKHYNLPYHK